MTASVTYHSVANKTSVHLLYGHDIQFRLFLRKGINLLALFVDIHRQEINAQRHVARPCS